MTNDVVKLQKAINMMKEALQELAYDQCLHACTRLNENPKLGRDWCHTCNSWVYRDQEPNPAQKTIDEVNKLLEIE